MNATLYLNLLGSPHILLGDQPLTEFITTKAQALLIYLAVTVQKAAQPTPHSRDALAALLWGEMTDAQAKQNLRAVLPDLRRLVGAHLRIERQTVAFDHSSPHWIDIEVLRSGLTPRRLPVDLATRQAAVDLYQGEFLSGFYVHNAPAFEVWVSEQREQLHILVVDALFALVREYIQRAEYGGALAANRRLLVLEPWSEPAHRQQMQILHQIGERSAALAQYKACSRILLAEFGIEPLPETTALYEQIRAGDRKAQASDARPATEIGSARAASEPAMVLATRPDEGIGSIGHGLPRRIELYGRQAELDQLQQWVLADSCRLVGIFGIGGQGKTALPLLLPIPWPKPYPLALSRSAAAQRCDQSASRASSGARC